MLSIWTEHKRTGRPRVVVRDKVLEARNVPDIGPRYNYNLPSALNVTFSKTTEFKQKTTRMMMTWHVQFQQEQKEAKCPWTSQWSKKPTTTCTLWKEHSYYNDLK